MKPKLREVEVHPIHHQGQPMLLLRDPLRLSDLTIAVPRPLAPLLGLMDGTRDEATLEAALQIRAGVRLAAGLLPKLLDDLDTALLLDNERFAQARADALRGYREAPFRPVTLGSPDAPPSVESVSAQFEGFLDSLPEATPAAADRSIRGLVSPHIDYERGGAVYAEVWRAARKAVQEADLVIVFGTDHQGSSGALTLTRQSYATPWGILPTETEVVDELAAALDQDRALGSELHHRTEHSIELAMVWLHFIRGGKPVPLVPILCGSFDAFVKGESDPAAHAPFATTLEMLHAIMAARRTLVVAAADLAHVGPAFGDPRGLDFVAKAQLRGADERLLDRVYAGDATGFFDQIKAEGDRRNVCGLPPIYLTLRLLGDANGEPAGYALCPADSQGTSVVTIAGVILR